MNKHQPLYSLLPRLWRHIPPRRRWQLAALIGLMLLGALAEVISLGMMLPFLGVITAPDRIFADPLAQPVIHYLGLTTPSQLLLPLTILFAVAAIVSGMVRLSLLWTQTHLGNAIGSDLGSEAFLKTLHQPYSVHCARNSSEIIALLLNKINTTINFIIIPLLSLITSGFIVLTVIGFMLYIDPELTSIAFCGFGLLYMAVAYTTKKWLALDSQRISHGQDKVTKVIQEGLGGIRDVIIHRLQDVYYTVYKEADRNLRKGFANINIIGGAPRPIVESLGLAFIAAIAYFLSGRQGGIAEAIPMLGALALSAQRLLPLVQQSYSGWVSIMGGKTSLGDVLSLLDQPLPSYLTQQSAAPLPFDKEISLHNVFFRYHAHSPWILNDINLNIPKGSRIGFVGITGSGKSTLLDIIMGLLAPGAGEIRVDGTAIHDENRHTWQAHLAHVPQTIFLTDNSLAENIAFGVAPGHIDMGKVRDAARKAQIADTIESWPEGYDTVVGERGVRLSGGQRQRIGIARALYREADIIIFDEATSALDSNTEQAVIEAIEGLSKELTILIVAHRHSTLKKCDFIIELKGGMLQKVETRQELPSGDGAPNSNAAA